MYAQYKLEMMKRNSNTKTSKPPAANKDKNSSNEKKVGKTGKASDKSHKFSRSKDSSVTQTTQGKSRTDSGDTHHSVAQSNLKRSHCQRNKGSQTSDTLTSASLNTSTVNTPAGDKGTSSGCCNCCCIENAVLAGRLQSVRTSQVYCL